MEEIEKAIKKYIDKYGMDEYYRFLVFTQSSIRGGIGFNCAKGELIAEIKRT